LRIKFPDTEGSSDNVELGTAGSSNFRGSRVYERPYTILILTSRTLVIMYTSPKASVPSPKVLTIIETTSLFIEFTPFALTD
jgi:hypothetical protein